MRLELFPSPARLVGQMSSVEFEIVSESLRSVYFRAPVFLRDNYQPNLSPEQQFSRSQWAAFIRALTVFSDAKWINHPTATYQAEIKPFQLSVAASLGFKIPRTVITNDSSAAQRRSLGQRLAVKTLDTTVLNFGSSEGFIYTNLVDGEELCRANISTAPIIVQEAVLPKVDIRATVVGNKIFAVEIVSVTGVGFANDWRENKARIQYRSISLPKEIEERCCRLVRKLGLVFGGIDLAMRGNEYYFIEINPTGEWAWLMPPTGFPIDEEIAGLLSRTGKLHDADATLDDNPDVY
ncbi:ATP-grasp domain-containing protein [Anatilimnocola aggregata]|nr:RimK-like protein [Anatilimnocola aggregata]